MLIISANHRMLLRGWIEAKIMSKPCSTQELRDSCINFDRTREEERTSGKQEDMIEICLKVNGLYEEIQAHEATRRGG
jgi:hypothetical protein